MGNTLYKGTAIGGSIVELEEANTMVLATFPTASVEAIAKDVLSFTFEDSIDKVSFVHIAIGKGENSLALSLIFIEIAFVRVSVSP